MSLTPPGTPTLRVVLIVDDQMPSHQAVNAAAVLGASAGTTLSLPIGPDGSDATGTTFPGIITAPIPVLVASNQLMRQLFRQAHADDRLTALPLTETARRARTYDDYLANLAGTVDAETEIVGLLIAGPRGRVTKLTKRLPLMGADSQESRRTTPSEKDLATLPADPIVKSFAAPDDSVAFAAHGHAEAVMLSEVVLRCASFEPGWDWAEVVGPQARTDRCPERHVGLVVSGRMLVEYPGRSPLELGRHDLFELPAGHNARTLGDVPCVIIEFTSNDRPRAS